MTDNEFKYCAFLSYGQMDNRAQRADAGEANHVCWGNWLHEALKSFSIPAEFIGQINGRGEIIPERIHPVFQDESEQPEDANLSAEVRQALEQSRCLVVICSPRSAQSLHVNEAVRYFKQLGRGQQILPLVIAGEPNVSDKSGASPADECFVPALRHPVQPDGTLDVTRPANRFIYVDARHGVEKREILAYDHPDAEADLATAKTQLIALLLGVGFNGLWSREQKRHFVDLSEARQQAVIASHQVEEAQRQIREAQEKVLEVQNLPCDVHSQIQEAQIKAQEAGNQAREAQRQLQEFQNQVRDTQSQLEEARGRMLAAESKVQEAQNQAQEARRQAEETLLQLQATGNQTQETPVEIQESQRQAEEARRQVQEFQNQLQQAQSQLQEIRAQVETAQNQVHEAQKQLQESENKARDTQSQLEETRHQVLVAENKFQEAQNQVHEAQQQLEAARNQIQEVQNNVLETQGFSPDAHGLIQEARSQAEAAQQQVLAAQKQIQESENKARDTQNQLEETRSQVSAVENKFQEAQNQIFEVQNQTRTAQSEADLARNQARELQAGLLAAENQLRSAQNQVAEVDAQARATQSQLEAARNQAQAAERKILEEQNQVGLARTEARAAQDKISEIQNQTRDVQTKIKAARRHNKVLAVIAVLALLAAGVAGWQRKVANQDVAKVDAQAVSQPDAATNILSQEQIQQALQKMGGQDPLRQLDELAARIPVEEIPATLTNTPALLDDRQRTYFQKQLLTRLSAVNPPSAMTNASVITGKIVDAAGTNDSNLYLQLAVLDSWTKTDLPGAFNWVRQLTDTNSQQRALEQIVPAMAADNLTNTFAELNTLQPAPSEKIYAQLFQRWATNDPAQAVEQWQSLPDHSADSLILSNIVSVWGEQSPTNALAWLQSQPEGDARSAMITDLFKDWSTRDLTAATAACQQLPDGIAKTKAWEYVLNQRIAKDPASAADDVTNLPPGDYRQSVIAELCQLWTNADINIGTNISTSAPPVLVWAQSLPLESERVVVTNDFVISLAKNNSQAALQFATQNPGLSDDTLGVIAEALAKTDFTAATNWVSGLPTGEGKNTALSALTEIWAQTDPQSMITYALNLPAGETQTRYLTAASRPLAVHDFPGLVELLRPLANNDLRQQILESAGSEGDATNRDQLAKSIVALPADNDQQAAIKGLLSRWTPVDPAAALNWLSAFPETNAQPAAVQSVIKAWSQTEPAAAAQWLTNAPVEIAGEGTVNAFLTGAVEKYPDFAAQWTQSVTNEADRQKYQVQVAEQWLKTDPSAAQKWINTLNLPEVIKPQP